MSQKTHKNCLEFHKNILESDKFNFRCRKEYIIPVEDRLDSLDLACFRKSSDKCRHWITAIGIEAESKEKKDFNSSAQIRNNKNDLMVFSNLFGKENTKTYHITTNEEIDFDRENLNCDIIRSLPDNSNISKSNNQKKNPFTLKPFDLTKKNMIYSK